MTDPYIQINGTKIEVFDNDLSAVKTIKQLSNSSKLITATRDLAAVAGDVSYTGVDFTPTSIICDWGIVGGQIHGHGFADSTKAAMGSDRRTSAGTYAFDSGFLVGVLPVDGSNYQTAIVKTYDTPDGFTLTWDKTGSPTGIVNLIFLCFR